MWSCFEIYADHEKGGRSCDHDRTFFAFGQFLLFNFCFFCYDGDVTGGAIDGVLTFGYREMNQTLSVTRVQVGFMDPRADGAMHCRGA